MADTNGGEATRQVTVALEEELGEISRQLAKDTAFKATQDQDFAYILAYQINVMIEANMRLRKTHRISGKDLAACLQLADYMTRVS